MIRVSRVTKRSKACKRIQEIKGGMGDCRHTDLRPAIAGAKDIVTLEELGMGRRGVLRMRVWLVVGQVCVSQALIERRHLP
jgi:hypothetical protein